VNSKIAEERRNWGNLWRGERDACGKIRLIVTIGGGKKIRVLVLESAFFEGFSAAFLVGLRILSDSSFAQGCVGTTSFGGWNSVKGFRTEFRWSRPARKDW
jgi:hypothetical protein